VSASVEREWRAQSRVGTLGLECQPSHPGFLRELCPLFCDVWQEVCDSWKGECGGGRSSCEDAGLWFGEGVRHVVRERERAAQWGCSGRGCGLTGQQRSRKSGTWCCTSVGLVWGACGVDDVLGRVQVPVW